MRIWAGVRFLEGSPVSANRNTCWPDVSMCRKASMQKVAQRSARLICGCVGIPSGWILSARLRIMDLLGRTYDLKATYKQLPLSDEMQDFARLVVWDPIAKSFEIFRTCWLPGWAMGPLTLMIAMGNFVFSPCWGGYSQKMEQRWPPSSTCLNEGPSRRAGIDRRNGVV